MNIYIHELKSNGKSILTWALCLSVLIVFFLSLYPAFTKDVAATKQIIDAFPPAIKAALGISMETFFTIFGFYMYIFSFVILAGSIFAMNLGVAMTSKEERDKTADFLLAKPISRNTILNAKIFSALTGIFVVDIIFTIIALITGKLVSPDPFSTSTFLLLTMILPLVQMFYLALGSLLSVSLPKIKSIIAVSLPIVFAFFAINMFGSVLGDNAVRYITPFKFYDPIYAIKHGEYEMKYLIIELVFVLLAIVFTYIIYNRKDTPSAT